jgi:hypothetical protein
MNYKMTGLRFTPFLSHVLPALIVFSLGGCSASQPVIQEAPAKIVIKPAPAPALAANDDSRKKNATMFVPDYPERHVVVKGDTLWDISKKFLKDPWLWPSVWHINPNIRNPHLIYPGDVIVMYVVDGKPYITLDGQAGVQPEGKSKQAVIPAKEPGLKVVKRSPSVRTSNIEKSIATIPMSEIRSFLDRPRVVTEEQLENAPYIVSSYEEHLISSTGNRVYALNLTKPINSYNIVRPGKEYVDPETDDVLGYEAIYLADAKLLKIENDEDKPSTLLITKAFREVLNNDVLIPGEERDQQFQFTPRAPEEKVHGQIMSVFNGVSQIGQYMVVVLNRGEDDGLAPGHVLAIKAKGLTVDDKRQFFMFNNVDLPDERAGLMMVFKTYKKISYALIMDAYRSMHVNDHFENP